MSINQADLIAKTSAQLVATYNALQPKKPLKKWAGKKTDLIARILKAKRDVAVEAIKSVQPVVVEFLKDEAAPKKRVGGRKPKSQAVPSGRSIREAAHELLLEVVGESNGRKVGLSYEEILRRVKAEFPESDTTNACLRWYAVRLNKQPEIKLPVRPRKKIVREKAA